ncbi:winged helix-turn-helix transcriptional regulator [Paenibacillus agricola]|uniref:Helix-turn-helix transcriptional regulator n=1 Tax=Paenibacillus agricola TaxID=2716264 RepID=A0ABX0JD64_9BACL|nr:helix-turn-helix domain-containing protein [Paenibacillus agricola]NHN31856.1 helix-turn-helix transcriptional regulator [Paenibacillus agricola]
MSLNCKYEKVLEVLLGKWKTAILYQLYSKGTMRFGELQRAIPDITKKMLTQQLRELEYHDILLREVYHQIPPKVEYSISAYGQGLLPVLLEMNDWGMAHIQHLNELYGEEGSVKAFVSRIDEIAGK